MQRPDKCPKCGGSHIGRGKFTGYAALQPLDKLFSIGSPVVANVCTDCGYVIDMYVTRPEKFK